MFICSPIGSYCAMRKTYNRCYRNHGVVLVFVKASPVVNTLGSLAMNADLEPVTVPGELPEPALHNILSMLVNLLYCIG